MQLAATLQHTTINQKRLLLENVTMYNVHCAMSEQISGTIGVTKSRYFSGLSMQVFHVLLQVLCNLQQMCAKLYTVYVFCDVIKYLGFLSQNYAFCM